MLPPPHLAVEQSRTQSNTDKSGYEDDITPHPEVKAKTTGNGGIHMFDK